MCSDQTSVIATEFHGWQSAMRLANGLVDVVVVPDIGRILHYSFTDQDNWLYINPEFTGMVLSDGRARQIASLPVHTPFGGDRIWPMQEDDFVNATGTFRPADFYIDGLPWSAQTLSDGVRITSLISQFSGVQIERTIRLAPKQTSVSIKQKMTKIKQCEPAELVPLAVTIWNISVIDSPDFIVMPIANENVFPENDGVLIHQWPVDTNHAAENLRRYGSYAILEANLSCPHQKMGANADGWIAAVRNDTAMIEIFDYDSNAIYPDGGTSATTFTAGKIGELECLSPLVGLMVGQSIEFDLVWDLMDLAPAETNEESRAVEIDSHVRKLQRR